MLLARRFSCVLLAIGFVLNIAVEKVHGRSVDYASLLSQQNPYDVIVIGGDAEGIAAAIGAARAGSRTLLVDTRPVLGGLLTRGWLNTIDLNLDRSRAPLNNGIFGELFRKLDDQSFDVAHMETILEQLVASEQNIDLLKNALTVLPVVGSATMPLFRPGQTLYPDDRELPEQLITTVQPLIQNSSEPVALTGVEVFFATGQSVVVKGNRFIDATQDADLAVAAGSGWSAYGEDVWGTPRNMAITLVFRLGGITDADWKAMYNELKSKDNGDGLLGATRRSIWGFGEILQQYPAKTNRIRMRALNLGRQLDGSVLANALLLFGFDGLSRESRLEARRLAEAELENLLMFLQQRIPNMSAAKIAGTAPELYVRTSRQIRAHYRLTVDDVLENRDFADRMAFGSYPLDIQAQGPDQPGDVTGRPEQYAVPLRCLIPVGFTNLLVVGRSAGFDSLAQSSTRTVPVGMAAGQGAGVTAMVSIKSNTMFNAIASDARSIAEIHRILADQAVFIGPALAATPAETLHWAYPGLQFLRRKGHVSGGYSNNYGLDKIMSSMAFVNRLVHLRTDLNKPDRLRLYDQASKATNITLGGACQILALAEQFAAGNEAAKTEQQPPPDDAFNKFKMQGLFASPWPTSELELQKPMIRGAAFMLLSRWANAFKE